jgi:hypothetical protein
MGLCVSKEEFPEEHKNKNGGSSQNINYGPSTLNK